MSEQILEHNRATEELGKLAAIVGKRCALAMDKEGQNPERARHYGVLHTSARDGAAWLLDVRDALPRHVASQIPWKKMQALAAVGGNA